MDTPTYDTYDPKLAEFLMGPDGGLTDGLCAYLAMRMAHVEPGVAVVEVDVRPELVHGFGAAHGGVVATIVDQALGSAVFPLVPVGTWPATLEFKLNYLAAARRGVIRATGTVVSLRKRTAVVRVEVENEGRTIAAGLGTISLNPPSPAAPGAVPA
jgi:1,4-dihydroxy-2-naphthoyl-CoA hydrolase